MPFPNKLIIPANLGVLGENIVLLYTPEADINWGDEYSVSLYPIIEEEPDGEETPQGGSPQTFTALTSSYTNRRRLGHYAEPDATVGGNEAELSATAGGDVEAERAERQYRVVPDAATPGEPSDAAEGSGRRQQPTERSEDDTPEPKRIIRSRES